VFEMTTMREVVWNSLVSSLQSGRCVLVLGSDIVADPLEGERSTTAEPRSVRDAFCDYLAQQLEEERQSIGERVLFAIAQQYEDLPAFASVSLKNIAAHFFRNSAFGPGPLYRKLARCPFSLILTTCHDALFAEALSAEHKSPSRYWYHYRGEPRDNRELESTLSPETPAIYHLFGTFNEPNSLVLTENDLLDFINNFISCRPGLPNSLRVLLRHNTFLFVGFGIRHWYIRVLLKILLRTLNHSGASVALESLASLDARERDQTVLFYKRGARVEVVDTEADNFVQELLNRFGQSGGYLGAQTGIRRAQVFISYERSDEDVAKRLCDSLPKGQFDSWLDSNFLQGGEDWNMELEEKLRSSDYFLILNSENLLKKMVGYVNKEVLIALDLQKHRQRGMKFIIPIQVEGMTAEAGRRELREFQQLPLRSSCYDDDVATLIKTIFRDFQLRMR
jgi:hypothetical protein